MPRIIKEPLYQSILQDYNKLRELTKDESALATIDDRIKRLELAPMFRKGQNYTDETK